MALVLRVDLAYVPWSALADEFGHGEPAAVLKLFELARGTGLKFHFFASNASLRAFPAAADAVLGEGHDLDWLCLDPSDAQGAEAAKERFALAGNPMQGSAYDGPWPADDQAPPWATGLKFISAEQGPAPEGPALYPVRFPNDLASARAAGSLRQWEESMKQAVNAAAEDEVLTLVMHPLVLAKHDPSLRIVRSLAEIAAGKQIPVRTLRDLVRGRA